MERRGVRSQRLKADICFVYVVLCQDAAIFYESKPAFLARTPRAARCQEKTFPSATCFQVKQLSHERLISKVGVGSTTGSRSHRRSDAPPFVLAGLCVPEPSPTRAAHKLEGAGLIFRQTAPMILSGSDHPPSER